MKWVKLVLSIMLLQWIHYYLGPSCWWCCIIISHHLTTVKYRYVRHYLYKVPLLLCMKITCVDCGCSPEECVQSKSPECPSCLLRDCCCWHFIYSKGRHWFWLLPLIVQALAIMVGRLIIYQRYNRSIRPRAYMQKKDSTKAGERQQSGRVKCEVWIDSGETRSIQFCLIQSLVVVQFNCQQIILRLYFDDRQDKRTLNITMEYAV